MTPCILVQCHILEDRAVNIQLRKKCKSEFFGYYLYLLPFGCILKFRETFFCDNEIKFENLLQVCFFGLQEKCSCTAHTPSVRLVACTELKMGFDIHDCFLSLCHIT
jgi:hypothetical protein